MDFLIVIFEKILTSKIYSLLLSRDFHVIYVSTRPCPYSCRFNDRPRASNNRQRTRHSRACRHRRGAHEPMAALDDQSIAGSPAQIIGRGLTWVGSKTWSPSSLAEPAIGQAAVQALPRNGVAVGYDTPQPMRKRGWSRRLVASVSQSETVPNGSRPFAVPLVDR